MRSLRTTKQFERDLRRVKRRRKKLDRLWALAESLVRGPHKLSGEWDRLWECHIEPDWLLIWDETEQTLTLVRTGTHADLFE